MAFKQVFYALQEVFPQVDLRILKAVASQYSSDVDAAVEFVLSDVLPVVSEPTEPHYVLQDVDYTEHGCSDSEKPKIHGKSISLADQRATEDANILSSPSAGSNNTFGDSNASPDYFGALYINNKKEGCSKIEDKVVMNESRTTPTVECAQFVSSSTPSIEPFLMEYETSASRAFASHSATENEKVTTSLQKDALCSLYESTIIKMKEIELLEENSELEKQAAAKAHKDFLAIVEHFNQLIENSNMSNDKQAQIVREENSLLAALAQELQSRLSNMSAQRDESLTIIEEIKFELDAQLATLMEEEAAARQQISQEEKLAELVRKENEAILENIMKESQKLQKEAEENILLRGFLLDRTGMIDALQGEISSIHSNVMALKERTHRNNFKSAVVSISNLSASTYTAGSKGTSASGDRPLGNDNYIGLPQEQMIGNHSKHDVIPSDDEWEVLGTAET